MRIFAVRQSMTSFGEDQLAVGRDAQAVLLAVVLQDRLALARQQITHLEAAGRPLAAAERSGSRAGGSSRLTIADRPLPSPASKSRTLAHRTPRSYSRLHKSTNTASFRQRGVAGPHRKS